MRSVTLRWNRYRGYLSTTGHSKNEIAFHVDHIREQSHGLLGLGFANDMAPSYQLVRDFSPTIPCDLECIPIPTDFFLMLLETYLSCSHDVATLPFML